LSDRPEAGVRIGSLVEVAEVGRLARLPGISSFRGEAHDAIEATTTVGLNQIDGSAGVVPGVMPIVELAIRGRVRTLTPPRPVV
jgi:hypothetical protein